MEWRRFCLALLAWRTNRVDASSNRRITMRLPGDLRHLSRGKGTRARTRRGFTCVRSDKASVGPACNHGNVEQQCQRSRSTDLAITASSKHGEEGRKEGPGHREGATGEEAAVVFMAGATQTELRQRKNAVPCLDGKAGQGPLPWLQRSSRKPGALSGARLWSRRSLRHAQRRTWSSLR